MELLNGASLALCIFCVCVRVYMREGSVTGFLVSRVRGGVYGALQDPQLYMWRDGGAVAANYVGLEFRGFEGF